MATAVFTDAEMTLAIVSGQPPGSDWFNIVAPAWLISDSMNGSSGTVTYTSPAAPTTQAHLTPLSFLDDDASIPPVITMTNVEVQFTYTVVCSGSTLITDGVNPVAIPAGGGSAAFDSNSDPAVYFGGTSRADLFGGGTAWQFSTTDVSLSQAVTVSGYTVTVTYTVPVSPEVTRIKPSTGSVNGGQSVTITGTGFTGALSATLGGVALTSFVVVDDETITGVTGEHASGLVDVDVAGVGTLTDGYAYIIPPSFRLPPLPTNTPIRQGGGTRRG